MLFKQCLNAVLIGIGHLVLGIKMYRKKRYVFSTLFLLNVFQSYRQKKGLNIFKLLYYAIHRTDKSHTFASSI